MVEFSFDVVHIAGAGYLPETYHHFIGFRVAKDLLERSFLAIYGIELKSIFLNEDLAIGTYRRGASEVIPKLTQIAWKKKKDEILKTNVTMTRKKFVYRLSRSNYEREWGRVYRRSSFLTRAFGREGQKIGLLARILIFLFELLPKIGPLRTLQFRPPTNYSQGIFVDSFRATLDDYQARLAELRSGRLVLENKNLDTGKNVRRGEYRLADKAYSSLLSRLAANHFEDASPQLRNDILLFYTGETGAVPGSQRSKEWRRTMQALQELRAKSSPVQ
jgi:hypothetical protein